VQRWCKVPHFNLQACTNNWYHMGGRSLQSLPRTISVGVRHVLTTPSKCVGPVATRIEHTTKPTERQLEPFLMAWHHQGR
jgi:hypothetical protein